MGTGTLAAIIVYLGCYTDALHTNGLFVCELDVASGRLSVAAAHPERTAIYQALSPDGKYLYSCAAGGVASYRISGKTLEFADRADLGGTPCHVAAMPDGNCVVWADYTHGKAGSSEVNGGRFGKTVVHSHRGSGPNLPRQDRAHCHQALPTPDGRSYCVVDLGLDEIVTYPDGRVFSTSAYPGAGPRHIVFGPDGRTAFLAFELKNLVAALSWDAKAGFKFLDVLPTLSGGGSGRGNDLDLAAAVRMAPDGKGITVSNRGENSLVSYGFDAATGKLSPRARSPLPGSWPRDFIFVSDTLALAAMERSGDVHTLRYDAASGRFTVVSTLGGFFRPVALLARASD